MKTQIKLGKTNEDKKRRRKLGKTEDFLALFGACHIFPFINLFFSKLKSFHKTYTEVSESLMTIRENSLQLFSIISFLRGGQYFYINYTIFSSSTHQNSVITHVICIIQQSSFFL